MRLNGIQYKNQVKTLHFIALTTHGNFEGFIPKVSGDICNYYRRDCRSPGTSFDNKVTRLAQMER